MFNFVCVVIDIVKKPASLVPPFCPSLLWVLGAGLRLARASLVLWVFVAMPVWAGDFAFLSPQFDNISDAESIPEGVITALAQDAQGFVWVGTQNGLLRHDGYHFRSFNHDEADSSSLAGDYVLALCATRDGRLWVGTVSDGVAVFDPVSERFTRYAPQTDVPGSLAGSRISALVEDAQGGVWMATDHGLDYLPVQGPPFRHFRHDAARPGSLLDDNVRSLLLDKDGRLWVGSASGLQRMLADRSGFELIADKDFSGDSVPTLFQAQDGKIWVGTSEHGAAWLDGAAGRAHWLALDKGESDPLNHHWIRGIAQVQRDQIWLASFGGGIAIVNATNGQVLQHLHHDPMLRGGLAYDLVAPLMLDRAGLLWVGTWGGGLQRFNANNPMVRVLRHHPKRTSGLSHPAVTSVLELANGQILLGLDGNGIDIIDRQRGRVGHYRAGSPDGLPEGAVRALAQTPDGSLWAGTRQAGLVRRVPGRRGWHAVDGLPSQQIRKLMVSRTGQVWAATNHGVARWNGDLTAGGLPHFNVITDEFGQPMPYPVESLAEDAAGRIWAGSQNGLWVWHEGGTGWHGIVPQAGRRDSLVSGFVTSLLLDHLGRLWVDTDKGLERLQQWDGKQATFEHVYAWFGAAGKDLGANLLEDRQGRIWTEAAVIDPVARKMQPLGKADGLDIGTGWIGAYGSTRDGLLLFGGTTGAAIIDPLRFQPWRYAPPVVLTGLHIHGQASALDKAVTDVAPASLTLPPEQRNFAIEFAALDYSDPRKNRYQYRLQGYDKDWIGADSEHRVASYGNLWPGHYILQVRGSNRLGQWSEHELRIPIQVLPWFWQTWWFVLLLVLLAGALIYAGMRWRVARLRAKSHRLQAMIIERTADVLRLGEIGRELAATLDMERAFERVHQQIRARLDADVFLIGIVELGCISFVYTIEHQRRLPNSLLDLDDTRRPAVWCVREQRELICNTCEELNQFFGASMPPLHGDDMETVVYLPLLVEQRVIGCLSVQSPKPHAYNHDQLELLRILASYTAIAVSNSAAHSALGQSHEELAAALEYLRETQAKLIQAERQQISLDLHDNLSQTMTGVLLQLDTAREVLLSQPAPALQGGSSTGVEGAAPAGLPYVERAIELARTGMSQTRHLLNQLRSAKNKPTPINLVDALKRDLPRLTVGTGIKVSVQQQGEAATLSAAAELALFRVAQEAVTNALRHAGARQIAVTLTWAARSVVLSVADDGKGFDPASPALAHGLGLFGMKQRMGELSGTLSIESTPGKGTLISATLPLVKEDQ